MVNERAVVTALLIPGGFSSGSIAVPTSKRAQISDPQVRKLADDIIATQQREIGEMERYIDRLETQR